MSVPKHGKSDESDQSELFPDYLFVGTDEQREGLRRRFMQGVRVTKELTDLSESGKINAFLRKYGLVTYRCKRGCLLGAVFNYRGEKYFYHWDRRPEIAKEQIVNGCVEKVEDRAVLNVLGFDFFDLDPKQEERVYAVGNCRHFDATILRSEVLNHIDALKTENKKTVYLSRP